MRRDNARRYLDDRYGHHRAPGRTRIRSPTIATSKKESIRDYGFGTVSGGDNARYLPQRTFATELSIALGKDAVDLYFFGAGHTDGDAFVVYPSLGVVQTGDMFALKDAPFCDRTNGGSCLAFPETLQRAV